MNLDLSNKTLDVDVLWYREGYTIANVIEWGRNGSRAVQANQDNTLLR